MIHPPYSPAFQAAVELIGQEPLPADAEARLAELETQIEPAEQEYFGDLWEAFLAAGGVVALNDD